MAVTNVDTLLPSAGARAGCVFSLPVARFDSRTPRRSQVVEDRGPWTYRMSRGNVGPFVRRGLSLSALQTASLVEVVAKSTPHGGPFAEPHAALGARIDDGMAPPTPKVHGRQFRPSPIPHGRERTPGGVRTKASARSSSAGLDLGLDSVRTAVSARVARVRSCWVRSSVRSTAGSPSSCAERRRLTAPFPWRWRACRSRGRAAGTSRPQACADDTRRAIQPRHGGRARRRRVRPYRA